MSSVSRLVLGSILVALCAVGGCKDDPPPVDPPIDAPVIDAPAIDAPVDAMVDAPIDAMIDGPVDAMTDAGGTTCDPLAPAGMSGCAAGQKCAWITITDIPQPVGMLGCVPTGTVALNNACTIGPPGQVTGFDNCVEGAQCVSGICQDVCGMNGQPNGACPAGSTCTRYAGVFANPPDDAPYGLCRPSCDPITQLTGTGASCPMNQGCYVLTTATTTTAVCAAAGMVGHGQPIVGTPFANSCLPGNQPRRGISADNTVECGALCRPAAVTSTTNQVSEGGVAPHTCVARGAAPPEAVNGESCRYWWAREPFDAPSPFSNTLGWCFRHTAFQYDSNGDSAPDAPFPRCINLTTGDVVPPIGNPPHNDAQFFWCVPLPATVIGWLARPATAPAPLVIDQLGQP